MLFCSGIWRAAFICAAVFVFGVCGAVGTAFGVSTTVVVSAIYGGGGNIGSNWRNDYVELHNVSATSQTLTGWSVQYHTSISSTGSYTVIPLTCGGGDCTMPSGGYLLVQLGSSGTGGSPLPTPDVTAATNISSAAGEVALVSSTTALVADTGCAAVVSASVDFVGYGASVPCYEGTGGAPPPNSTNADIRGAGGCTDTDNNAADFSALRNDLFPPRNSSSAAVVCAAAITSAAEVVVSGHVTDARGRGIRGATVAFADSRGRRLSAVTNAFGYYTLANVPAGETFIANVASRGLVFVPRAITVRDALAGVDFAAR